MNNVAGFQQDDYQEEVDCEELDQCLDKMKENYKDDEEEDEEPHEDRVRIKFVHRQF